MRLFIFLIFLNNEVMVLPLKKIKLYAWLQGFFFLLIVFFFNFWLIKGLFSHFKRLNLIKNSCSTHQHVTVPVLCSRRGRGRQLTRFH
jgi:hypothetical protein